MCGEAGLFSFYGAEAPGERRDGAAKRPQSPGATAGSSRMYQHSGRGPRGTTPHTRLVPTRAIGRCGLSPSTLRPHVLET